MATKVTGDQYKSITAKLFELGRQLNQEKGYPFNPEKLKIHLQEGIEGKFQNEHLPSLVLVEKVLVPNIEKFHAREAFGAEQHAVKLSVSPADELLDVTEICVSGGMLRTYYSTGRDGFWDFESASRSNIALAHVWWLLAQQGYHAGRGPLVVDGCSNIFCHVPIAGNRYKLFASWYEGGWCLRTRGATLGCSTEKGDRVFTR